MNYYDMLGVKEIASPRAIDAAYKALMKRLKKVPESYRASAVEMMGRLNEAYSVLSGENSRKTYDVSSETPMSAHELGRYKNLQEKKYRVSINQSGYSAGTVRMPACCACCMSQNAEKKYPMKKTRRVVFGGFIQHNTSGLELPLCAECETHIAKANGRYMLVAVLPAVFAAALGLAIKNLSNNGDFGTRFALPFGVSVLFYLALAMLLRFRKQPRKHTCHNSPARYRTFTHTKLTFEFTNWEFAKRFADANGSSVTEKPARRHALRRSVLTGYDAMDQVIIYPLLFLILTAIFFGAI